MIETISKDAILNYLRSRSAEERVYGTVPSVISLSLGTDLGATEKMLNAMSDAGILKKDDVGGLDVYSIK